MAPKSGGKLLSRPPSSMMNRSDRKLFIAFSLTILAFGAMNLILQSRLFRIKDNGVLQRTPNTFSVDILSVASINRQELVDVQKRMFGLHSSVRAFFIATELDDDDPWCYKNLTWEDVVAVSNFCRKRPSGISHEMKYLRGLYARTQWLEKKPNPVGWLCAIPRPYSGLRKAYLHYMKMRLSLPDYFIILDDDTYFNMEDFQRIHKPLNSMEAKVVAGCLVRQPVHSINFTFPWGGFGTVFSKGSLAYLFHPIYCTNIGNGTAPNVHYNHPNAGGICNQLVKDIAGELKYFKNGNSLLDLIYNYVNTDKYRNIANWDWQNNGGFCMHSDWVMGFFVNFYNVSNHVEDKYYQNVPQARIESFEGSNVYQKASGYCKNEGNCPNGTMICHKPSVQWIDHEISKW
jgi:hypothetical protein